MILIGWKYILSIKKGTYFLNHIVFLLKIFKVSEAAIAKKKKKKKEKAAFKQRQLFVKKYRSTKMRASRANCEQTYLGISSRCYG